MSSLGIMLDTTLALYGMEMNYVHHQAVGRDNCYAVKWTPDSLTRICWFAAEQNHLEFSTRIHLHERMSLDARERFIDLLNAVAHVGEEGLPYTRSARIEHDVLIVERCVVIEDATHVGQVEQAYAEALQDIMSIEAAI